MMIGAALDQIRTRSPPARLLWLCKGLEDLGLDASCLASVREQVETERRLKEPPQIVRALRNRIGRRYPRPALEKIESESIDRVSDPGGLEAIEDQPYRH
jgi:hypothetical protein